MSDSLPNTGPPTALPMKAADEIKPADADEMPYRASKKGVAHSPEKLITIAFVKNPTMPASQTWRVPFTMRHCSLSGATSAAVTDFWAAYGPKSSRQKNATNNTPTGIAQYNSSATRQPTTSAMADSGL